jgi:hypothetical protein
MDCCEDVKAFLDFSPKNKRISLVKIKGHRGKRKLLLTVKGNTFGNSCLNLFQGRGFEPTGDSSKQQTFARDCS